MGEQPVPDTRARILATAREVFVEYGYQRSTLRQIAERLGVTKAAILYHFPSKDHILGALAGPIIADLESVLSEAAEQEDVELARWTVLEGWLDVWLARRHSFGTLFQDLGLLAREQTFARLMAVATRAHELVAGPLAGRKERIRATQALAMIGDPVIFFADAPTAELRREVLAGVHLFLGRPEAGHDRSTRDPSVLTGAAGSAVPGDLTEPVPGFDSKLGIAPQAEQAPKPATQDGSAPDRSGQGGALAPDATARRRGAGRPRAMNGAQIEAARRMYAAGDHSVPQIAAALGVSRATVYRHLEF